MNAGQKSAKRIAAGSGVISRDTVCTSCRHRLSHQSRRHAATAAATAAQPEPPQSQYQHIPPVTATGPQKAYRLLTSPVLSRPPLLTRDLTSFEKAYYLYQKRLNERLALPFSRYFYYKKSTPGDTEWKRKVKARKTAARDIGVYSAYDDEGWNDEVLIGDETAERESQVQALIRDAEGKSIVDDKLVGDKDKEGQAVTGNAREGEGQRRELQKIEVERPMSRLSEADQKNDVRSLSRKMDRSLYLMIKNKAGYWRFPEDRVYGRENLHQAAERILLQSCGINMNTWIVANHPIGHYTHPFKQPQLTKIPANSLVSTSKDEGEREEYGEKVFFMKARIMAGQADLSKNVYGDTDFAWLAKEEVKERVAQKYWASVSNMLTDR